MNKDIFNYFNRNFIRNNNYIVQKGDSLYKISKKFGVSVEELMMINDLTTTTIEPDQVLVIPTKVPSGAIYFKEYVIMPGDTLEKISSMSNVSIDSILNYNDLNKLVLEQNQVIQLPYEYKTYVILENDDLDTILQKTNMTPTELIKANSENWLKPGVTIYVK